MPRYCGSDSGWSGDGKSSRDGDRYRECGQWFGCDLYRYGYGNGGRRIKLTKIKSGRPE